MIFLDKVLQYLAIIKKVLPNFDHEFNVGLMNAIKGNIIPLNLQGPNDNLSEAIQTCLILLNIFKIIFF